MNQKPVIIVYGALRSGTTLLRLVLDMHPELECPGETDFIVDYLQDLPDGTVGYVADELMRNRIYRSHHARYSEQRDNVPATPDAMIARIRDHADHTNPTVVLMLHRHIDRALDVFTDAKVIHLLRDPRDVARSSIGMGWAGNVYHGSNNWLRTESTFADTAHRIQPNHLLEIRYEQFIVEPEETLTDICSFIGVPFAEAMLSYDEKTTYSKPDPSLIFQWKTKLSPYEIGLVEGRLGPMLEKAGYEASGHPQVHLSSLDRAHLSVRNKLTIWQTRFQRYGVKDPMLVALGRRLNIPTLGAPAKLRIDEKSRKYRR